MYKQSNFNRGGFRARNSGVGFNRGGFRGGRSGYGSNRIKTFDPTSVIANSVSQNPTVATNVEGYVAKNKFTDFRLTSRVLTNVLSRKFNGPTPIQDQTIPEILNGRDVVGVANTGTGKTAAFLIPLINKVDMDRRNKILIIAPTRELAIQIDAELNIFARGLNICSAICIGGVSIRGQIYSLNRNPQFVIGTPGRLLDLWQQRKIDFKNYNNIVMDEVDRMLDMGFVKDVEKIVSGLPARRQSLFFSATLDESVKNVMRRFVSDPVHVSVKSQDITTQVTQEVVKLNGREKIHVLYEILDRQNVKKVLVFSRTKHGADRINRDLLSKRFQSSVIHGNKTQSQRQRALESFKRGHINVLVATDVASRGIDVNDISHVINFDLPASYEDYIHRIGRTGRAGKAGIALTFV